MAIRYPLQRLGGLGSGVALLVAALLIPVSAGAETDAEDEPELRVAQAETPETPPPAEPPPPPPPSGDSGIEEIVVLGAQSEGSDDYAIGDSVTGFGAEDLAALGAASIADLASFTPNLEIVTSGATTPTFFIRGVGLNDFNANSTGAVALYVDDVAINAPALQLGTLFDMEAVNVMRGPQGDGLARNSSAGAIKLYSKKPTGEFGGFLRLEGGNYAHQDYEGAIDAPIVQDLLSSRFAFRLSKRDGTMRNRCGSAPPRSQRAEVPASRDLFATRRQNDELPWSICGEPVFRIGDPNNPGTTINTSQIPAGLPRHVNDRDNWAARGTFMLQPTLDQTWLVGLHGARRDELSRVGQSYGTNGFFCLDGDLANCGPQGLFPAGSRVVNVLGGRQGTAGYRPRDVLERLRELAPCYAYEPDCSGQPTNPTFAQAVLARAIVARELARDLDDEPWEGDFNHVGVTTNDTWGAFLKGEIALPLGLEVTSVTGYDTYDRQIDLDLDFSPETLFHIDTEDSGWQVYQDLKLAGELELVEDSPVRWDVGGWILREALDVQIVNDLGLATTFAVGEREYEQTLTSAGAYAHVGFDFWDDFTLEGGGRWNWEEKDIDYLLFEELAGATPLEEQDVWSAPTGTVRLVYRFREDTEAYWKYTRGWKPGHYNATGSRIQGITIADPEFIDAFETGINGSWLAGRLNMNLSLFYYNYTDYQIFTAQQFAGGGPEFVVLNASDAEVYGAEVEIVARPWDGMFLTVRPSWLETQFLDFVLIQQSIISRGGVQVIVNRELQNSGNPLLNSPRFKVSLTADQTFPLGPAGRYGMATVRWDGVWTDDTYYDATKGRGIPNTQGLQPLPELTIAQRAFWLHNFRVAFRPPGVNLEAALWVRNAFNKPYKTFAFDGSTFQNTTIYFVGDPRTWGGSVTVNF